MSYETRVGHTKQVFAEVGIEEDRFWELVDMANWPEDDYERPKLNYLKTLEPEEGKKFRKAVSRLWSVIDKFIGDRNPAQGGDDSHSDFVYHIIGCGKREYYASLKDYERMVKRGNKSDYIESFSYSVPYEEEWDSPKEEIADLTKRIKRQKEKESGVEFKYQYQICGDIQSAIEEMDGEEVARIYNQICDVQIEYVEDSVWKVKETA